ncbi:MAG TPA: hypothetical protein VGN34_22160, partial [Ktedonobacteraceae bacterium]
MNDHYQQNQDYNPYSENNNAAPRSGLLRDYRPSENNSVAPDSGRLEDYRQNQPAFPPQAAPGQFRPFSPAGGQFMGSSGRPSMPPGPPQGGPSMAQPPFPSNQPPVPLSQPPQPPPAFNRGFLASTMQMVRQFSGKMVALNHAAYEPPPPPLALYHSQSLPDETQPKPARWRRSHALRMSMRVRHRRTRSDSMPQGRRILVSLLIAVLALFVVTLSSSGAYAYSFYQSELPQVNNIANQHISQITRIYDRNGVLL